VEADRGLFICGLWWLGLRRSWRCGCGLMRFLLDELHEPLREELVNQLAVGIGEVGEEVHGAARSVVEAFHYRTRNPRRRRSSRSARTSAAV